MKYTKKQLLEDDKFKIGFEFEFVAYDLYKIFDKSLFRKLKIRELLTTELIEGFDISEKTRIDIKNFTAYAYYNNTDGDYYDESDLVKLGADKIIAIFKLIPKSTVYRKTSRGYIDVTSKVISAISSTDPYNIESYNKLIRILSTCYIDSPVTGKYSTIPASAENSLYNTVIREFKKHTGYKMKRVASHEDITKKKYRWYLTEEYVDEINEGMLEYGFEIVTPPLPPHEALAALSDVLDFLKSHSLPFKIKTGKSCGVHINISHQDVGKDRINELFYALMFDEKKALMPFGRVRQDMCDPMRPGVVAKIKELTRNNIITLTGLRDETIISRTLDIVLANIEYNGLRSARFDNAKKWEYAEYRMGGGKNYENKYKELSELLVNLLRFTMRYPEDITKDKKFIREFYSIMKSTGVKHQGASLLETIPDFVTKFPKTKRPHRLSDEKLLKIRDV